jgi:anti-anti-sigma regulatory factor
MSNTTTLTLVELNAGDCGARLASLLTPQTTVVISCEGITRLPVDVVAAAQAAAAASNGLIRLEGLCPTARLALQAIDPDRRLAVKDPSRQTLAAADRPYQVTINQDGKVIVRLFKGIGQHVHLNESTSHEWIRGLDARAVEVDLEQIEQMNSLLVAWLLQINHGAGAGRCTLSHVSRRVLAQLTQLRLNHLLSIV